MICGALAIAFHVDIILQQITAKYLPTIGVENNSLVKKELQALRKEAGMSNKAPAIGGKAPDFIGIDTWLNSKPLSIADLKGKLVLVDFWTYSCINCVRTLPYLTKWYQEYKDLGFVIVGVHTPEFAFEHEVKNIEEAAKRFGITYPIAVDNDFKTWRNYDNQYWPAHYLVDQQGTIREIHFGEGKYAETENKIRLLLGLPPTEETATSVPSFIAQTPEIYLGYKRAQNYPWTTHLKPDEVSTYIDLQNPSDDQVALNGSWLVSAESVTSQAAGAELRLNFRAKQVYLVMSAESPGSVTVLLDGKPLPGQERSKDMNEKGEIQVHESRMYTILDLKEIGRHVLTLHVPPGISLYAFTFGS